MRPPLASASNGSSLHGESPPLANALPASVNNSNSSTKCENGKAERKGKEGELGDEELLALERQFRRAVHGNLSVEVEYGKGRISSFWD